MGAPARELWSARLTTQLRTGLSLPFPNPFPKKCSKCGKVYRTAREWEALELLKKNGGQYDDGFELSEMRNCPCGSTLMITKKRYKYDPDTMEGKMDREVQARLRNNLRRIAAKLSNAGRYDLANEVEAGPEEKRNMKADVSYVEAVKMLKQEINTIVEAVHGTSLDWYVDEIGQAVDHSPQAKDKKLKKVVLELDEAVSDLVRSLDSMISELNAVEEAYKQLPAALK